LILVLLSGKEKKNWDSSRYDKKILFKWEYQLSGILGQKEKKYAYIGFFLQLSGGS